MLHNEAKMIMLQSGMGAKKDSVTGWNQDDYVTKLDVSQKGMCTGMET